jgi:LacI family transcriptional regulator
MRSSTLKSLSKATGFSVTTVSRALGGFDDVNQETRRVILEEAQRQGYEPNLQARLLQGQRSQTVGLIMPTYGPRFSDPFFSEFVGGIGNEAASAGFDLLLSTHAPTPDEIESYRRMISSRRVDGFILSRVRMNDARIEFLLREKMPFVVFGRTQSSQEYVFIDVDGEAGQRELTKHLLDVGHERIAYITPPQNLTFTQLRVRGFHQAMSARALGVPPQYLIEGDLTEAGGYRAAEALLTLAEPPSAIMTGNDLMAFGVMSLIQSRGLRVGVDIAVGGFDDIPAAEHVHPGLTTIHQPIYQIGQQVTRLLLDMIAGNPPEQSGTLLLPRLIVRGSTRSHRDRA